MINFAENILHMSDNIGSKAAYVDPVETLTYADMAQRVRSLSAHWHNIGLRAGDNVVIIMEDCVDWPVVFLSWLRQGIVPLPLTANLGTDLLLSILDFVDCRLVVCSDHIKPVFNKHSNYKIINRSEVREIYQVNQTIPAAMIHPDAPGYMGVSSGSTGMPKVAVHRHRVFQEILDIVPKLAYDMSADSRMFSIAKMSWGYGLHNSLTYTLGLGATAILNPDVPAPSILVELMKKFNPTIVVSSPSVIQKLLSSNHSSLPASIVHFHCSGEDLPEIVYDRFLDKFNLKLTTSIGMLETAQTYASLTSNNHEKGTVGKCLPGVELKIVNENHEDCANNIIGEILVKSPSNAIYYLKNYSKTKQTFYGPWVRTGDHGYINNNGNLVFVGRGDDIFKIGGLLVSPVDIEEQLMSYSGVIQALITRHNQKQLSAFIVCNVDFDLNAFKAWMQKTLFTHQIPTHIHLVDSLPETVTNKKNRKNPVG